MPLIIYVPVHVDSLPFIEFWAARYRGYDDEFYRSNIGQELTETRILE
jgi:hypothetical protein